jgi:hypothetical protein
MNRAEQTLAGLPAITTTMNYLGDTAEAPFMYYVDPPEGQPFTNVVDDAREVQISDVSSALDRFSIDTDGFEFVAHNHELADFDDDARVRAEYFPIVEKFFRDFLGVDNVAVYDYSVRRPDHGAARPDGIPVAGNSRRPIRRAHGDFALVSGKNFGNEMVPKLGRDPAVDRYRSFNFWRPIRGPLTDTPLGLCHPASVVEADLVPMKQFLGERINHISALRHNPDHRWLYRRARERHEGIVFSSYDSTLPCARGVVTHGAFDDPTTPIDGIPRDSIEIRVLAVGG